MKPYFEVKFTTSDGHLPGRLNALAIAGYRQWEKGTMVILESGYTILLADQLAEFGAMLDGALTHDPYPAMRDLPPLSNQETKDQIPANAEEPKNPNRSNRNK